MFLDLRRPIGLAPVLAPVLALFFLASPSLAQDVEEGVQMFREGRYEEARAVLASVVDAEPGNARAAGFLGLTLVELGRFGEAERHLRTASSGEPTPDQIQVGLARIHIERRDGQQAMAALVQAERINPRNADVFYFRGLVYASQQDFRRSAADLERAIQLDPRRAMAHYYAGLAYNGLKQRDKMVEHFQTFLRLAPDAPEAARVRSLLRGIG